MIYVYLTVNKINGKIYVGVHDNKAKVIDGYLGSGKMLRAAVNKHGRENFLKFILKVFDNVEAAMEYERSFVDLDFVENAFTYNIRTGGGYAPPGTRKSMKGGSNPFFGKRHTEDTKRKISKITRKLKAGVKFSEEHKRNISVALTGKKHSPKRCKNISKAKKGKPSPMKGIKYTLEITCPYCGKVGFNKSNMTRWHFNNCKWREQ